jgi:hypothetical protein
MNNAPTSLRTPSHRGNRTPRRMGRFLALGLAALTSLAAVTTVSSTAHAAAPSAAVAGSGDIAGLQSSGLTLSNVGVARHGTWAKIAYTTNAATARIRVSTYTPVKKNGVWVDPIMDSIIGPEEVTATGNVRYRAYSLTPDTTYWVTITLPTKANQIPVQAVRSFTTKKRTVTITWDRIEVTDDSDPGAKGAGDFTFWFRSNGVQIAHFSKDIKSDSTYTIDLKGDGSRLTQVVKNVKTKDIPFSIQFFENDIQSWDHCDGQLTGSKAWDGKPINKENACGTWGSMSSQYDAAPGIYGAGQGVNEGDTVAIELSPWKSSVHLTVIGTVTATWS